MPEKNGTVLRRCGACRRSNRIPARHLASAGRCGGCAAELPPLAEPLDVDAGVFQAIVADAPVPVLVDFWASWCPPCRLAAPFVKKVAASMAGRAIVLKVNTDQHPDLARSFDVRGIPNFVVIKGGNLVRQQAGLVREREMQTWLEEAAAAADGEPG